MKNNHVVITTWITWHNEALWYIFGNSLNSFPEVYWTGQLGDSETSVSAVWVWHAIWVSQLHSVPVYTRLETRVSTISVSSCEYSLRVLKSVFWAERAFMFVEKIVEEILVSIYHNFFATAICNVGFKEKCGYKRKKR